MASWPILSVVTFLPIVGAIFIAFLNDDESGVRNARWIALWTTLVTFAVSLILVWRFDPGSADFAKGIDSAKRAVALQPSLEAAHNVLAKYYLDAGQNVLAPKECRLFLEKKPSDQSALYHLIVALRKTGNQTEIPDLLKRLAKARQDATREEGEQNRYKLVVGSAGSSN